MRPDECEDKFDHDPLRIGGQTASSPDELRMHADDLDTAGWGDVAKYEFAAADAWEADKRDLEDFRSENATLRGDNAFLRKRLERYEAALNDIADYRDNDATIRALRIARAALAGED